MRRYLFIVVFLLQVAFGTTLPQINSNDVEDILGKMMEAHVSCKSFTAPLIKRIVNQFLENLDPNKTYFLKEDITSWHDIPLSRAEELQGQVVEGDYQTFFAIHEQMIHAIKRRERLEAKLQALPLPENVSIEEFKEIAWVESEEELLDRLQRIKALQMHAASKLDISVRDKALQRIEKKRLSREEELSAKDERLVFSNILKACASSFDAHTAYFTPAEATQFMIQVQQRLFGIGVQLRDNLDGFTVVKVIEGGPASATSLMKDDRIIAIDEEPVVGMEILDAVALIRGEAGSSVMITVLREEEVHEIEITRGEVVIQEARIDSQVIPFGDGVIAKIGLHAFYQDPQNSSASDLFQEIAKIKEEHKIKGLILDLRTNAGGVLPQAVAVTGLFITKGIVVSIKDNNGRVEHLRDIDGRTAYDGPLVVLTSKASASAAEIVAQTLQDYGRALVVGDEHTYGKGSFQTFTLDASNEGKVNPKGEFKVTRGRYYTVSGKSPQLVGVKPDIVIPGLYTAMELGEMHAKYALETDSIEENFHDNLSDIPAMQREQISWLYRYNLQPRVTTYQRHLEALAKNSKARIEQNKHYQKFLSTLEADEFSSEEMQLYVESDPQLHEAIHVTQDLIVFLKG